MKKLFCESSSSVDIFIMNKFLHQKKSLLRRSNCPKELPILKRWLLGEVLLSKSSYSEKNNYHKEATHLENDLLKEVATLKK